MPEVAILLMIWVIHVHDSLALHGQQCVPSPLEHTFIVSELYADGGVSVRGRSIT